MVVQILLFCIHHGCVHLSPDRSGLFPGQDCSLLASTLSLSFWQCSFRKPPDCSSQKLHPLTPRLPAPVGKIFWHGNDIKWSKPRQTVIAPNESEIHHSWYKCLCRMSRLVSLLYLHSPIQTLHSDQPWLPSPASAYLAVACIRITWDTSVPTQILSIFQPPTFVDTSGVAVTRQIPPYLNC